MQLQELDLSTGFLPRMPPLYNHSQVMSACTSCTAVTQYKDIQQHSSSALEELFLDVKTFTSLDDFDSK